jgi:hypothetical protein
MEKDHFILPEDHVEDAMSAHLDFPKFPVNLPESNPSRVQSSFGNLFKGCCQRGPFANVQALEVLSDWTHAPSGLLIDKSHADSIAKGL